ncbi:MAG: single-stranded-DNA-specific exonuclease RecJ [Chitinivibrionales bacterium]|nr:single-stranded-DNA-specific exonuclease RecJ [Chitinivibrionales bacterium]
MKFIPAIEKIILRQVDNDETDRLARELSVPPPIASILYTRGLTTPERCAGFFNPDIDGMHDPFLFREMRTAVERIQNALRSKEKIAVYGDYDVDGVTSTAMLVRLLRKWGADCTYYLPNRLTEGYGLSEEGIRRLAGEKVGLIITVDCGVSAGEEILLAKSLGIDVIVTDHHEPKKRIPEAIAVINPKIPGCAYPDKDLAGVGVALKLCQALVRSSALSDEMWMEYLDLAAVGTAADIVPLIGENRIITKHGLEQLPRSKNLGMRMLIKLRSLEGEALTTARIVFMIAPCINAAGRLGDSRRGVELLLTEDRPLARLYARELVEANTERQALDSRVEQEAVAWVENRCNPDTDFGIVAGNERWHCGVIGIVASKIVEKFHRPTILFSCGDDGLARGSGRSINGFHLMDALRECSGLLEEYGGHRAAAGMVIKKDNIAQFRERFNCEVRKKLKEEDLVPTVSADAEIGLSDITPEFLECISKMEPYGPGNMRPVLFCRNLRNRYEPRIVGRGHLKMLVSDGRVAMDAIGFNFGNRLDDIRGADVFALAFNLDENMWNGRKNLQMKVKGVAV